MRIKINIREEKQEDILEIGRITEEAFKDDPHGDKTEHLIVEALRKAEQLTISLVAELDSNIVGHVAISPVTISDGSKGWYGLGPISVEPKHQGQEIGSELMKVALSDLRKKGAAGCVLLGNPDFYSRFGFAADSGLTFPGVPAEYFQSISFGADIPEGEVTYHESFKCC